MPSIAAAFLAVKMLLAARTMLMFPARGVRLRAGVI